LLIIIEVVKSFFCGET